MRIGRAVILGLGLGLLGAQGCASAYWADRGNDLKDVVTLAVGLGLGAKARVGPLQAPLIVQSDYAGLRCGEWFASPMRHDYWTYVSEAGRVVEGPIPLYYREYDALYSGYEVFEPGGLAEARRKNVAAQGMGPFNFEKSRRNYGYYTQVEATVGAVVSLRVGLNPGELLDALAGFTTVDLLGDDVKRGAAK